MMSPLDLKNWGYAITDDALPVHVEDRTGVTPLCISSLRGLKVGVSLLSENLQTQGSIFLLLFHSGSKKGEKRK